MGQEAIFANMNPATSGKPSTRASGYHLKALAEIRNSLQPFANGRATSAGTDNYSSSAASTISTASTTSGVSSASGLSSHSINGEDLHLLRQSLTQLINMGYSEESAIRALKISQGSYETAIDMLKQQSGPPHNELCNGFAKSGQGMCSLNNKLIRKPSLERELNAHRGSPATIDSGAGSSRSDSPRQLSDILTHPQLSRQYSPSNFNGEPPPLPPPRNSSTPPPPPPPHSSYTNVPSSMQQLLKRMSPAPVVPSRPPAPIPSATSSSQNHQHGTSPVSARQPVIIQNGPQVQQQLNQQIQALNLYQNCGPGSELPPPYPVAPPSLPPYPVSIQNRPSPTQSQLDYRKSPSSGIYSGSASAGSASPTSVSVGAPSTSSSSSVTRPTPLQAWGARQAKTQPPIIMQSVKSTQVQKPVLQTAIAPTSPPTTSPTQTNPPAPPPSYASSIQKQIITPLFQKQQQPHSCSSPQQSPLAPSQSSTPSVPTTEPPSYASTIQALATQRCINPMPVPPYSSDDSCNGHSTVIENLVGSNARTASVLQKKFSPSESRSESPASVSSTDSRITMLTGSLVNGTSNDSDKKSPYKIDQQSPIPERKHTSKEKDDERRDGRFRNFSSHAFKFFMEQHTENIMKTHNQRRHRRVQLETEMDKIGLCPEAQCQLRKMLAQKESNYIRLKRAKMDKSMFSKIKPIGLGAFGEVTLVRKTITNHLYAMKTLRKADVLKRNQVAHVKAERDILAEADNEWVVKLYYSFQDKENLYFVMDYIPGGDLMSLLIKFGIFEEQLARFYLAELTCAVESVHKMGFIHRDIKPDNILIDRDGHIKLTDFGLCTGFRWTHNSIYYQNNGEHGRQDSLDPTEDWKIGECKCHLNQMKPLERRRKREQHQRCLAHSLVGTPNYIAPEVLQRTGYSQLCDWWSVGVILYEMLIGSPPFLANTPAETQTKVINWERTLRIPLDANVSPAGTDLILKLCTSADKRLGKNANEVKDHQFFAGIDFREGVRRLSPPYVPKIQYSTDTSNFDTIDPEKLRNSAEYDDLTDPNNHGFFEFTFRRFFDDGGPPFQPRNHLEDNSDNQSAVYVYL